MAREDQLGYRPPGHGLRVLLGALDARRHLLAASLELSLGEGGLEQDLGQEVETQRQILLEHGKCDRRAVPPGVAFEAAADELYGAVELGPGALGGAARQQVGGQVGEPSRVGRIVHRARAHVDAEDDDGDGRPLGHEQHRAVGQGLAMRDRTGGGRQHQCRRDADPHAEESHGHSLQSSVFLNLSTASEKITTPKINSGTRLGHR